MTEYFPAETGEDPSVFSNFQNCTPGENDLRIINTIASFWGENILGYLSLDIICSPIKLTDFLELRSRKIARFSEQIMSADKYPIIFSSQIEAFVYICHEIALHNFATEYVVAKINTT